MVFLLASLCLAPASWAQINIVFDYNITTPSATTITITGSWTSGDFVADKVASPWGSVSGTSVVNFTAPYDYSDNVFSASLGEFGKTSGAELVLAVTTGGTPSGNDFSWNVNGTVVVPSGYEAGDELHSVLVFAGKTYSDLGLVDLSGGTYTSGANTVTWSASPIPEPSTYAGLMGLVILLSAFWVRQVKQKTVHS